MLFFIGLMVATTRGLEVDFLEPGTVIVSWLPLIDLRLRQPISLTIAEKAAIDTNLNLNLSYILFYL